MDDLSFQAQLHELKKKIEELANRHPPSPRLVYNHVRPNFAAQMEDIKHQLRQLDNNTRAALHQRQSLEAQEPVVPPNITQPPPVQPTSWFSHNDHLSLPSGPLFWQLFTSLRSDVRSVEGRVTSLEQEVSDLEDKVDRWSPDRLTPTTTIASFDKGPEPVFPGTVDLAWTLDISSEMEPVDPRPILEAKAFPAGLEPVPSLSTVNPPTSSDTLSTTEIKQRMLQAKLFAAEVSVDMLRKYTANLDGGVDKLGKQASKTLRKLLKYHCKFMKNTWLDDWPSNDSPALPDLAADGEPDTTRPSTPTPRPGRVVPPKSKDEHFEQGPTSEHIARLNDVLDGMRAANANPTQSPEGVAFRDKELSRMDELLRNAQETVRNGEQQVQERDAEISRLGDQLAAVQGQCAALLGEIEMMRNDKVEREKHVRMLELVLQKRSADLSESQIKYDRIQECYLERGALMNACEDRTARLEEALRTCQSRQNEAAEEDVRRLQHFCEQKDHVLASQEQIIARGGKLLQQKDEDIENLNRTVKTLEDDLAHERRHRSRLTKLLDEKEDMLKQISRELFTTRADGHKSDAEAKADDRNDIRAPKVRLIVPEDVSKDGSERHTRDDPDRASLLRDSYPPRPQTPHPAHESSTPPAQQHGASEKNDQANTASPSPFSRIANRNDASPPAWSPEPIRGNRRLASEQRRAAAWGAVGNSRPIFGEPSNLGYRHHRGNPTRPTRAPDWANALPPMQDTATEAHRRRVLSVSAFPNAVPDRPYRMQSMAELRPSRDETERRRDLPRRQSMQDMGRRDFQAYAETEAESGDERNEMKRC